MSVNAMIVLFAIGLFVRYIGPSSWGRAVGYLILSAGFVLGGVLFGLRSSGRLGWYPDPKRAASVVSSVCAFTSAVLILLLFVVPGVLSTSSRLTLLVVLLILLVVFFASLLPDLFTSRE